MLNLGCGERYHPDWVNLDMQAAGPGVIVANLRGGIPFPDGHFSVVYHSHLLEHLRRSDAVKLIAECQRVLSPGGIMRVVVPDLEATAREYLRVMDQLDAGDESARRRHEWLMIELLDQLVRRVPGGEMLTYLKQPGNPEADYVIGRIGAWAEVHLRGERAGESAAGDAGRWSRFRLWLRRRRRRLAQLAHSLTDFRERGEVHQWMYDRHSLTMLVRAAGFGEVVCVDHHQSRIRDWARYGLDTEPDGRAAIPVSLYLEAVKLPGPLSGGGRGE